MKRYERRFLPKSGATPSTFPPETNNRSLVSWKLTSIDTRLVSAVVFLNEFLQAFVIFLKIFKNKYISKVTKNITFKVVAQTIAAEEFTLWNVLQTKSIMGEIVVFSFLKRRVRVPVKLSLRCPGVICC